MTFGEGVTPDMITARRVGNDLVLSWDSDSLTVARQFEEACLYTYGQGYH